jgi:Protein of unknown function (DUF1232)
MTVDEYIDNQRRELMSSDLHALGTFTDRLLEKLKGTNGNDYPGLSEAVCLIVQLLKSPTVRQVVDPLPTWMAEVGFAAAYLLKRHDLIPDDLPQIGLADDALILQRVIERNHSELYRSLVTDSASPAARSENNA